MKYDLLVAGEINPDLILSGDTEPIFGQFEKLVDMAHLTIGSSSAIFACGAARLGLKVAFVGVCGDDVFGDFMLAEMRQRKVDVSNVIVVNGGHTGLSVILSRGIDRAILTFPGLMGALQSDDISDVLLQKCRHMHVASYYLQNGLRPGLPELLKKVRDLGLSTSLDTNWDPTGEWRSLTELLKLVDVFMPNEQEALSITHSASLKSALRSLSQIAKIVVVKQGKSGASLCTQGQVIRVPTTPVSVVDSVGAGDSFDAGFLYGYLSSWPLEKSLKLGAVCGALSTRAIGGTTAQPLLDEALRYVS